MDNIMKNLKFKKFLMIVATVILISSMSMISGLLIDRANIEAANIKTAYQAMQEYIDTMNNNQDTILTLENRKIKEKIEKSFGSDAWSKVTYTAITGDPPIVHEVFEMKATGEQIGYNEYSNALEEHITKICEKYDFDSSYLDYMGNELLQLTPEETVLRNIIIQELSKESPVRISVEATMPYQYFLLSFDGENKSIDGMTENYRIVLIEKDENWQIYALYCDNVNFPEEEK